jgi:prepilin-type N-terminal cleavage/methylation domain-containing protein
MTRPRSQARRTPWRQEAASDDGFTLVELIIVVAIIPLIVGAITLGLISVYNLQGSTQDRLATTVDAQLTSTFFSKDVQSSTKISLSTTAVCGSGTQVLGLEWGGGLTGPYQYLVSYIATANASGGTYTLQRQYCANGSTTPVMLTTISRLVQPPSTPESSVDSWVCVTVSNACSTNNSATTPISATTVSLVTMVAVAPKASNYVFTFEATPRVWTAASGGGIASAAPFTVLGNKNCSSPTLTMANGSSLTVTIQSGGTTVSGPIAVASPCDGSLTTSNNSTISASSVYTSDPNLQSIPPGAPGSNPSTEYYLGTITDPLAAVLNAPSTTTLPSSETGLVYTAWPQGCSYSSGTSTYTCLPGEYLYDPAANMSGYNTVDFTVTGSLNYYIFNVGLSIPNNLNSSFSSGTYVFNGTGDVLTTGTSVGNGGIMTGTGVLFYTATGNFNFSNNQSINLTGLTSNFGVTLWDDAPAASNPTITLGNNGGVNYSYGGVYIPNGAVVLANNGTVGVSFIITSTAQLSNNVTVNIVAS